MLHQLNTSFNRFETKCIDKFGTYNEVSVEKNFCMEQLGIRKASKLLLPYHCVVRAEARRSELNIYIGKFRKAK